MQFSTRELLDLGTAWIVLGVAFAILLIGPGAVAAGRIDVGLVAVSLATAGLAFLLHELAHKVVAVRFGQIAEFRADYGMLFLALMSALLGFLFAAPGAVHHRGRVTERERGLISLAGPVTNLALAVPFAALYLVGVVPGIAAVGLTINLILAAFNMLPYGPLDGRTVYRWNRLVFGAVAVPSLLLGMWAFLFGPGF